MEIEFVQSTPAAPVVVSVKPWIVAEEDVPTYYLEQLNAPGASRAADATKAEIDTWLRALGVDPD